MTDECLRRRWDEAWAELGLEPAEELFDEVIAGWREQHRAYHNIEHLSRCLELAAEHRGLQERPAEVDLALFFHDAIYSTTRFDNEERSAEWAEEALRDAGGDDVVAARVRDLVLVTAHPSTPSTVDEAVVLDIDLAVLGDDDAGFERFQRAVRTEYSWVPSFLFNMQRRKVLRSFLDAGPIYHTAPFRPLEERARANLERALRA
ncbi:MAG: N-methyl-D-aspartate receptor NMDAR2C subunit [Acidobacteriota bacterium]